MGNVHGEKAAITPSFSPLNSLRHPSTPASSLDSDPLAGVLASGLGRNNTYILEKRVWRKRDVCEGCLARLPGLQKKFMKCGETRRAA